MRMFLIALLPCLGFAWTAHAATPGAKEQSTYTENMTAPEVSETSLRKLADMIRPTEAESSWKKVGWRTNFWAAVQEAKELQRPILLWAMNGHPCAVV
ncbi:MAG: hypothetical protein KIS92_18700 [Planctomycetota bacterium]|nr:hypothetical protein [Planctomycetota bacterium]